MISNNTERRAEIEMNPVISQDIPSKHALQQCPLCSASRFTPFKQIGNWALVKCVECQLVMLNPQPTAESLSALYDSPSYYRERIQQIPSPLTAEKRVQRLMPEFAGFALYNTKGNH